METIVNYSKIYLKFQNLLTFQDSCHSDHSEYRFKIAKKRNFNGKFYPLKDQCANLFKDFTAS